MRKLLVLVVTAVAAVGAAGAARAVVGGTPDGSAHPYVVLLRVHQSGGLQALRCTGVVLAPTKVVTAAHCLENAVSVDVWTAAAPAATTPPDATSTTFAIEPGYAGLDVKTGVDTHDLAVITFPALPVTSFPAVAPVGYTDAFASKSGFAVVGYGVQDLHPQVVAERIRLDAVSSLKKEKDGFNLRLSAKPGGACFGDSGGPVLDGSTVVAIVSFGQNQQCTSSYYAYRLDTVESRAFLAANGAL